MLFVSDVKEPGSFVYRRTVFFQDTDAAGVVYFANVLSMCHEAFEASLAEFGVDLKAFFTNPDLAIPIVHASVDFLRPMFCGDRLEIYVVPTQLSPTEFELAYTIFADAKMDKPVGRAKTRHVCIDAKARTRAPLSGQISQWLAQGSLVETAESG